MSYLSAAAVAAAALIYTGSMKWLKVVHVPVKSDKLKQGERIRVLHISDLHGNSSVRQNLNIWKNVERLEFDLAVITGDLILDYTDELDPHIDMLQKLAKKKKVFYVDGNHEKYIYADIKKRLEMIGVTVLCDERLTLDINGRPLNVIGVRDLYWQRKNRRSKKDRSDFEALFNIDKKEAVEACFSLLLSHQPQIVELLGDQIPDLILCGHTHGGQLRFPGLTALYAPGQGFFPKYSDGLYKIKNGRMYISKGIGATNFRVRFFNRPELAIVEICG